MSGIDDERQLEGVFPPCVKWFPSYTWTGGVAKGGVGVVDVVVGVRQLEGSQKRKDEALSERVHFTQRLADSLQLHYTF